MPGERNPQSAAQEFAPSPQGENVLDASMMAVLIVTKKEIWPQLKESTRNLAGHAKKPRRGWSTIAACGKTWCRASHSLTLWFLGSGALLAAGIAVSVPTPDEGKIGADTAAWTRVIPGHSQDRGHGKRQQSGHAGLDMACRASVQPGGRWVCFNSKVNLCQRC